MSAASESRPFGRALSGDLPALLDQAENRGHFETDQGPGTQADPFAIAESCNGWPDVAYVGIPVGVQGDFQSGDPAERSRWSDETSDKTSDKNSEDRDSQVDILVGRGNHWRASDLLWGDLFSSRDASKVTGATGRANRGDIESVPDAQLDFSKRSARENLSIGNPNLFRPRPRKP